MGITWFLGRSESTPAVDQLHWITEGSVYIHSALFTAPTSLLGQVNAEALRGALDIFVPLHLPDPAEN